MSCNTNSTYTKEGLAGIYLHYNLLTCFRNLQSSYLSPILVTENYSDFHWPHIIKGALPCMWQYFRPFSPTTL